MFAWVGRKASEIKSLTQDWSGGQIESPSYVYHVLEIVCGSENIINFI